MSYGGKDGCLGRWGDTCLVLWAASDLGDGGDSGRVSMRQSVRTASSRDSHPGQFHDAATSANDASRRGIVQPVSFLTWPANGNAVNLPCTIPSKDPCRETILRPPCAVQAKANPSHTPPPTIVHKISTPPRTPLRLFSPALISSPQTSLSRYFYSHTKSLASQSTPSSQTPGLSLLALAPFMPPGNATH